MHHDYKDIISRIPEKPKWWDSNAVPRYCDFHPKHSPNIYADQVILLRIACQGCLNQILVEMNWGETDFVLNPNVTSFDQRIKDIYYGDPPNTGCCDIGASMSSISLFVEQFWEEKNWQWVRRNDLENIQIESLNDYEFDINEIRKW